ncbi:MAG: alkaline phosphatase D family protein [Planctomycetota bacterium]|nr:alkaline phosphatase D family protein [Planctomycetota bacterium]
MRAVLLAAVLVGCASATPHTRIAFGSCAFQWKEQPIWDAVIATKPDLYLSLGDAIYGDFDGTRVVPVTKESLKAEWDELAARPKFQRLRKSIPIMAVWDNHDYGTHDGGAEFALKETSKQIFLDFFGEPAGSPRRKRAGIYDAKIFGRVQVILLDTRSFKGPYVLKERSGRTGSMGKYAPNPDPSVTLLGAEQWRWLEARLRAGRGPPRRLQHAGHSRPDREWTSGATIRTSGEDSSTS